MTSILETIHGGWVYQKRVRRLATLLGRVLPPGASVLDVGCGDGLIDRTILASRGDLEIRGVDVFRRPVTHIHVDVFDGHRLQFPDQSFDVVMAVDVLHHAADPKALLGEMARVARSWVVVKDHNMNGLLARQTLAAMDWVGNARHGVVLAHNYWTSRQWFQAFRALDLDPEVYEFELGIYPAPLDAFCGRALHFLARLRVERSSASDDDARLSPAPPRPA